MHEALSAALKSSEMIEKLNQTDQSIVASSPEDTAARLALDALRWGEVARRVHFMFENAFNAATFRTKDSSPPPLSPWRLAVAPMMDRPG
jgi:hypothetical protein